MAKEYGVEGGKPAPAGNSGATVQSGLSMSEKFDAKGMNTAPVSQEQARTKASTSSAGNGFTFKGN